MEDLLERLMRFLLGLVGRTHSEDEEDLQRLAAYVFAVAVLLHNRYWDGTWDEAGPPGEPTLSGALAALRDHAGPFQARDSYYLLIDCLVQIEERLATAGNIERFLLRSDALRVRLDDEDGRSVGLEGTVALWLRPPSLGRRVWNLARLALLDTRHPPMRPLPPSAVLERLALAWLEAQLPDVRPVGRSRRIETFDDHWASATPQAPEGPFELKVALCPLAVGKISGPRFDIDDAGRVFVASPPPHGLRGREYLEDHLRQLFRVAEEARVHLFIFPELSIDPQARDFIAGRLKEYRRNLLGAVAGSFHVVPEVSPGIEPGLPANEAVLLDAGGEVAWTHEKLGHFAISRVEVERFRDFFGRRPAELPHPQITEGIRRGTCLNVLDLRIGRFCLLICADATDLDCGYREIVRRLRPDFLLIVSLSVETDRFESFARELKDLAIGTLFVNAACATSGGNHLALIDLAFWSDPKSPPTQVRWLPGENPRRYDLTKHEWAALEPEVAVALLPGGYGLVLDLGRFYRRWLGNGYPRGDGLTGSVQKPP